MLGGGENAHASASLGLAEINSAGERILAATALARVYPEARNTFTGGSGAVLDQGVSRADVAERILADVGLGEDRLRLERLSRNTAENAALARALVAPEGQGPWLLLTSAFHMPRAMGSFCAAGWEDVVPYLVDFRSFGNLRPGWDLAGRLTTLNPAIKEWIGLIAYRVTGRIEQILPDTADAMRSSGPLPAFHPSFGATSVPRLSGSEGKPAAADRSGIHVLHASSPEICYGA